MESVNIKSLGDLAGQTERSIAELHGMGPKGVRILKECLKEAGLSFKIT